MSDGCPTNPSEQICDVSSFVSFFNETVAGTPIPKIKCLNPERTNLLKKRIKEHGKEGIAKVIRKAAASSFLTGGENGWVVTFDWLIRPRNFLKILEGNFDDRPMNIPNSNINNKAYGTDNNNGYRSREDIIKGAARIVAESPKVVKVLIYDFLFFLYCFVLPLL